MSGSNSSSEAITLEDVVYGLRTISDPVLVDLIKSNGFERLKDIFGFGPPQEWWPVKGFSKYEHCIGVLILLSQLGAQIEEQIAGLLHDATNRAFTHVYDWVVGRKHDEAGQDDDHERHLRLHGFDSILHVYGLQVSRIADLKRFSLAEAPAPLLCADRVDYTLREMAVTNDRAADAQFIAKQLININGQMAFSQVHAARDFAVAYAGMQKNHWAGEQAVVRYWLLCSALQAAMEGGFISESDFLQTNHHLADKLRHASSLMREQGDRRVDGIIQLLDNGFSLVDDPEGIPLNSKKFRWVDPPVYLDGSLKNLSLLDPQYDHTMEEARQLSRNMRKVKPIPRNPL